MNNTYSIPKPKNFNLSHIFDCGQCFRFNKVQGKQNTYSGVAHCQFLEISCDDNYVHFHATSQEQYEKLWHDFFDLDFDYSKVIENFRDDATLFTASTFSSGIRILKQSPWETLCSFIISQNNNIPRIKGIIENLSCAYGEKIQCFDGVTRYAFPTPSVLVKAGEEEIFKLKTGFRAKYIYDAAKKVESGEIDLSAIYSMETPLALTELCKICGVGPKVASCTLLFGFSKRDAFPIDVWVKKVLEKYYKGGISPHLEGEYAGLAQQYLFYYERCQNNVYL